MILKASQRSGGIALANHLLNDRDNDHVTLHSLRGFIADDLHGAMKEAQAVSRGTKCKQFLFSLSLNPPERESVPDHAFEAALEQVEAKLGLADHPRAVVFHEKEGRRHAHAVWSRIDAREMRAINLPHFKHKLMDVSRELYRAHGWQMPRGLAKTEERSPFNFTLEEWQQAKRAKIDPKRIKRDLQACWEASDDASSFSQALKSKGYAIARGDRRGYVAIDWRGEVYALPRWLGQKTTDVKARLGGPDKFPSVDQAKAEMAERIDDRLKELLAKEAERHAQAEAEFDTRRRELALRQRTERAELRSKQAEDRIQSAKERQLRLPRGLKAIWYRLTGRYGKIKQQIEQQAEAEKLAQSQVLHDLVQRQLKERRELLIHQRSYERIYKNRELNLGSERPNDLDAHLRGDNPKRKRTIKRNAS